MAEEQEDGGGLDITDAVTGTGTESSGSKSTSTTTEKEPRTNVHIKGEFGTELFRPDTNCEHCEDKAEGVLVGVNPIDEDTGGVRGGIPLCKEHRREKEAMPRVSLDKYTYETFR